MKHKKILFSFAAATLMLAACDDQVMQWVDPDHTVKPEELPLELSEKISRYDFIKNYMSQYRPGVDITVGMGLDNFLSDETYMQTVLDNFQGATFGNALKHQSVVQNNGSYNWSTIDRFIALNTGLKIHGHNFVWHTQQNQNYLKSLIAPEMIVESDPGNDIQNILSGDSHDFDGGTLGNWIGWGNESTREAVAPGRGDDGYCAQLYNPTDGSAAYSAQFIYQFPDILEPGEYKFRFYAKAKDASSGTFQICNQNLSHGNGENWRDVSFGSDWTLCEVEIEITKDDSQEICINFGYSAGTYYVDDIEFGLKQEAAPSDPMINILAGDNSDFEGGTKGSWGSWGNGSETSVVEDGYNSDYCVKMINPADGTDYYVAQMGYDLPDLMKPATYIVSFYAKSEVPGEMLQFSYQNNSTYAGGGYHAFEIGTDWTPCEYEFEFTEENASSEINRILINFGKYAGTFYIDDIKFGEKISEIEPAAASYATRASVTYKPKSAEEKRVALLGAMEDWIKESTYKVGHLCTSWDVINEPIGDDSSFRGIDNRGWMSGDSKPEESEETGLILNWANDSGNGHFYWGYFLGMEYAVKAFEYARKYADEVNPDIKLFVNDYNLETSPSKLAKLIEFVNYIDNNGAHVDGIGTQMHVSGTNITKEQVDAMFRTLAQTGKLIRITELDVAMGTANPSVEQQQQQADVYKMILTSFFENIPEAQQHGITIWSLTDNAKEHEYWLNGDTPNIFDANYGRKIAYKGVCDAIIGFDPSEEWQSTDWSKEPK